MGWRRRVEWLLPPVLAFGASRLIVLGVLYMAPAISPGYQRSNFVFDYDSNFYLNIAQNGYPQLFPPGSGQRPDAAFFPLLPWLTRWLSWATHLPLRTAAVVIITVAALAATVGIWWLALETLGEREGAKRTVMLALVWPASFVLSMYYTEGLLISFAAACLIALRRRRWLWAGVAAFLASLTRPDGVALALACAWCAFREFRTTRSLRPLVAPVMAPLGMVFYFAFLGVKFQDPLMWFKAEEAGWNAGFDFGRVYLHNVALVAGDPMGHLELAPSVIAGVLFAALVVWACLERLPVEQILYSGTILVLTLGSGFGGSIPRFAFHAFPLFIAPGKRLGRLGTEAFAGWMALSTTALVCLMLYVTTTRAVVP